MTFCLGMKIKGGLVAFADTRITSGTEYISARKMSIHQHGHHSMLLMTSGLRSARDKAVTYFEEVIEKEGAQFDKLYKATNAFAEQVRRVAQEDRSSLEASHLQFNLHALVGGQLEKDDEHKLYLLYPQGNWVEVTASTPYFIIGVFGYGKPLLDRVLRYESSFEEALKIGVLAFDATRKSSNDVGYPLDAVIYRRNTFDMHAYRFEEEELAGVSDYWQKYLLKGVAEVPKGWLKRIVSDLPKPSLPGGSDEAALPGVPGIEEDA